MAASYGIYGIYIWFKAPVSYRCLNYIRVIEEIKVQKWGITMLTDFMISYLLGKSNETSTYLFIYLCKRK